MIKCIKRVILKILIILFIINITNTLAVNAVYLDETIQDANNFINDGRNGKKEAEKYSTDDTKLQEITDQVYNTLLALGIVLSVIIGGVLGIQLLWGSIEQQVKAKEMLMPYVAGCGVVFGAFGIWKLSIIIFSQL